MKFATKFTRAFPCSVPIVGAPMAGVSGGQLAAEATRAGALGFIAGGYLSTQEDLKRLQNEISIFRDKSEGQSLPLSIGFISHITFGSDLGWDLFQQVVKENKPEVVQFFAPAVVPHSKYGDNVKLSHDLGCKVMAQVGTVKDAQIALDAGVDCIVAQGTEAGGHGIQRHLGSGTLSLTADLVRLTSSLSSDVPVLAAGGIVDGKGLLAALSLGADGVVLGTRLWASVDANGSLPYREALVRAKNGDAVVRTRAFDTMWNSIRSTQWPEPFDSSGVLRNSFTEKWDTRVEELRTTLQQPDGKAVADEFRKAGENGDIDSVAVFSGKGVGGISSLESAYDIVKQTEKEAIDSLESVKGLLA